MNSKSQEYSKPSTNGTILNGADATYTVRVSNLSVALLLDEKILDSGLIDIHLSNLLVAAESSEKSEEIKFGCDRVTARGCRLNGSTFEGSPLRIMHLPFKVRSSFQAALFLGHDSKLFFLNCS